jgi:hypothetical protein
MILRNGKFSGKILRKIFRTGKFSMLAAETLSSEVGINWARNGS